MNNAGYAKILFIIMACIFLLAIIGIGIIIFIIIGNKANTLERCVNEKNCVLAYIGDKACSPCDLSNPEYQCVSLETAEIILKQDRNTDIACKPCNYSGQLFRCKCRESKCLKTSNCKNNSDCFSDAFGNNYKCINEICTYDQEL
ncbi:hypothetical protein KKF61_00830 [Patescibacteria group bacterium]|nr:hypothetical protein [Patescibacteria group bacterium]MBU0964656.1 hypothetical protein [Patescibacteria group bacterium]